MSDDQLQQAQELVIKTIKAFRPTLLEAFGATKFDEKTDGSLVTLLDKQMEDHLYEALAPFDTGIGFVGEEGGRRGEGSTYWLVDPIDGTEHFIRGIPFCSNMVTLIDDGQPVLAVVYNFVHDELFTARQGQGTFANGKPVKVANRTFKRSMIGLGFDYEKPEHYDIHKKMIAAGGWLSDLGAAGFEHMQVASGRLDGAVINNKWVQPHDVAPGILLVREAGGVAVNLGSDTVSLDRTDLVLVQPIVYEELKKLGIV